MLKINHHSSITPPNWVTITVSLDKLFGTNSLLAFAQKLYNTLEMWIQENSIVNWVWSIDYHDAVELYMIRVSFKDKSDAALFKLTWW